VVNQLVNQPGSRAKVDNKAKAVSAASSRRDQPVNLSCNRGNVISAVVNQLDNQPDNQPDNRAKVDSQAKVVSAANSRRDQLDSRSCSPVNVISAVVSQVKVDSQARADNKAKVVSVASNRGNVISAAVSQTEASLSAVNRAAETAEIANGIIGPSLHPLKSKFALEMPPSSVDQSAAAYT
jgi:hypothetical protein